jgi:hypothetical protein
MRVSMKHKQQLQHLYVCLSYRKTSSVRTQRKSMFNPVSPLYEKLGTKATVNDTIHTRTRTDERVFAEKQDSMKTYTAESILFACSFLYINYPTS